MEYSTASELMVLSKLVLKNSPSPQTITFKGFYDLKFLQYDTTCMNQAPQDRKVGSQRGRGQEVCGKCGVCRSV